jgi:hypothetical protein
MTDPAVQMLLDLHQIQTVLGKYVIGIDSRAFDLLDQVFTPDAQILLAGMPPLDPAGYKRICADNLPAMEATQHHLGMPVIEVTGDTARSRCYFIAQHAKNALRPDPLLIIGGWYDDELRRTADGWRITRRTGTAAWFDGNPDVLGYPVPPGGLDWSPGRNAPAWLLGGK